ncbi:hypothetical protein PSPO01_05406 [Paraphaeosphaeria sporulosa]
MLEDFRYRRFDIAGGIAGGGAAKKQRSRSKMWRLSTVGKAHGTPTTHPSRVSSLASACRRATLGAAARDGRLPPGGATI